MKPRPATFGDILLDDNLGRCGHVRDRRAQQPGAPEPEEGFSRIAWDGLLRGTLSLRDLGVFFG